MTLLINKLFLLLIYSLNKLGRGHYLKKKFFNCKSILENNFIENEGFNFIQVGAYDGVSFDFLYEFVIKRKSKGLVIEPIEEYFLELTKNYINFPEILKINKAVHSNKKTVEIYKINKNKIENYPDWVKGIASFNKEHHKKVGIKSEDIVEEVVQADTLMNIINKKYKYKKLDFFQIDTEGYDFEVLKMFDFENIKPKIIKFESINLDDKDLIKLNNFLTKKKYYLFKEKGDTIAINLRKVKAVF